MSNSIEFELKTYRQVHVESDDLLKQMQKDGLLIPFTHYFTPDTEIGGFDESLSSTSENAVQNKVVKQAIEGTLLWSGTSNGNITLLDSVKNYKYIVIYYAGDIGQTTGEQSLKIDAKNYSDLHLAITEMDASNSGNFGYVLKQSKYTLTDNLLTVTASCRMYKYQSDSIIQMDQKNQIFIKQIIGFNY